MKLVRYGAVGQEKPGLIDKSGQLRDLSGQVKDLAGEAFSPASLAKIAALDAASLPAVSGQPRIGSPVGGLPKFIAIGLNYSDHAAEVGMPIPAEPIIFMKANNSLCGPNDKVEKPRGSTKLDWECEIADHHRHPCQIRLRGRRAQPRRRLRRLQRRLRAQFPDRAPGPVDQGQVARHVRPARPVARHQGRDPGRAEAVDVARRQRQALPDRIDRDHDLRRARRSSPTSPNS